MIFEVIFIMVIVIGLSNLRDPILILWLGCHMCKKLLITIARSYIATKLV